ncbi:MAG: ion transporter [Halothiobacillaceae bacterium]
MNDLSRLPMRERAHRLVESRTFQRFIIALILFNALILGLETSDQVMDQAGTLLKGIDRAILAVFVVEILIKLYAQRGSFFRNPWNLFDFFVVAIALVPTSGPFAVLRVLRLLRLISMIPKLRFVVEALLAAIPGIVSIAALLGIVFYVFAIIAHGLFGETHPQWFGTLGGTLYTLFQVMTLESWSMGIARPVMESHPWAGIFFVFFILVATFTMLNLFIALIIDAMQSLQKEHDQVEERMIQEVVHREAEPLGADTQALREEVRALRAQIRLLSEKLDR